MQSKKIRVRRAQPFSKVLKEVAARTGVSQNQTRLVVETFFDLVKEQLYDKMSIRIPSFGIFTLKHLKARLFTIAMGKGCISGDRPQSVVYRPDRFNPCFMFEKKFRDMIQGATEYRTEMLDLEDLMDDEE